MLFCGKDDFASKMKGVEPTLTRLYDSNQVSVQESVSVQELSPNQKIEIHILFPIMECDYPNRCSISSFMSTRINVGSGIGSKWGKDTGVNIDSKIGIESQS